MKVVIVGGVAGGATACARIRRLDDLRARLHELPRGKTVYVMCQSGLRSYLACRILSQHGFDCRNFSGGYSFYKSVVLDEQAAGKAFPCGMERE